MQARRSIVHHLLWKLGRRLRGGLEADLTWEWRAAVAIVAALLRLLALTLRYRVNDPAGFMDPARGRAGVLLLWHNRIIAMPGFYAERQRKNRAAAVLTSAGPEGSLLAHLVSQFGLGAVRGSAARRGSSAVREMTARLASGTDVFVTPDGSRGPRYYLKPGAIFVAQKTGCPLFMAHVEYSHYVRLRTWDGLAFPLPFARVDVAINGPVFIAAELDPHRLLAERERVEELMRRPLLME